MLADYQLRKKYHYCVKCGKQDAFTLNGRARCADCQEKANNFWRIHPEYNEKGKTQHKEKYLERKENGLCVVCGAKAQKGKVRCAKCLFKDRLAHRIELNREMANDLGICVTCLKNPQFENYKLCESCYKKSLKSLEKARKNVNGLHKNTQFIFGKGLPVYNVEHDNRTRR